MFKKSSYFRWLLYLVIFSLWSLWLIQQRVSNFERFIVHNCVADISSQRPAVLVLGGGLKVDGTPDIIFMDRLDVGAEIHKAGLVNKILISGTVNRLGQDEAEIGKNYLLSLGVPPQDVFVDRDGYNTYHSIFRAKNIFRLESLLIVTQDFHLPRTLYLARRLNLDAWGCRADKNYYSNHRNLSKRESMAKIKAWLDINLGAKPRLRGSIIDISDDGRQTWSSI